MNIFISKNKVLKQNKKVKVGLALGGGATRGIAHIGALKVFEENGIKFDMVAGTSAGSIVGCMYAAGKSADEIMKAAKEIRVKDIKRSKFFMPSKTDGIQELIIENLGDIDIQDLKIPFCAVAVDLITSNEIVFTRGNLPKIIAGSCAVPGVFVPVEYEDMHLADGGLQNNIPSDVPRFFGCDYVIAIDVNSTRGEGTDSLKIIDVLSATIRIMSKSNSIKGYINADYVIKPSMKKYKSTKIDEADAMFQEGYMAALDALPKILEIISRKPSRAQKTRFRLMSENRPKII